MHKKKYLYIVIFILSIIAIGTFLFLDINQLPKDIHDQKIEINTYPVYRYNLVENENINYSQTDTYISGWDLKSTNNYSSLNENETSILLTKTENHRQTTNSNFLVSTQSDLNNKYSSVITNGQASNYAYMSLNQTVKLQKNKTYSLIVVYKAESIFNVSGSFEIYNGNNSDNAQNLIDLPYMFENNVSEGIKIYQKEIVNETNDEITISLKHLNNNQDNAILSIYYVALIEKDIYQMHTIANTIYIDNDFTMLNLDNFSINFLKEELGRILNISFNYPESNSYFTETRNSLLILEDITKIENSINDLYTNREENLFKLEVNQSNIDDIKQAIDNSLTGYYQSFYKNKVEIISVNLNLRNQINEARSNLGRQYASVSSLIHTNEDSLKEKKDFLITELNSLLTNAQTLINQANTQTELTLNLNNALATYEVFLSKVNLELEKIRQDQQLNNKVSLIRNLINGNSDLNIDALYGLSDDEKNEYNRLLSEISNNRINELIKYTNQNHVYHNFQNIDKFLNTFLSNITNISYKRMLSNLNDNYNQKVIDNQVLNNAQKEIKQSNSLDIVSNFNKYYEALDDLNSLNSINRYLNKLYDLRSYELDNFIDTNTSNLKDMYIGLLNEFYNDVMITEVQKLNNLNQASKDRILFNIRAKVNEYILEINTQNQIINIGNSHTKGLNEIINMIRTDLNNQFISKENLNLNQVKNSFRNEVTNNLNLTQANKINIYEQIENEFLIFSQKYINKAENEYLGTITLQNQIDINNLYNQLQRQIYTYELDNFYETELSVINSLATFSNDFKNLEISKINEVVSNLKTEFQKELTLVNIYLAYNEAYLNMMNLQNKRSEKISTKNKLEESLSNFDRNIRNLLHFDTTDLTRFYQLMQNNINTTLTAQIESSLNSEVLTKVTRDFDLILTTQYNFIKSKETLITLAINMYANELKQSYSSELINYKQTIFNVEDSVDLNRLNIEALSLLSNAALNDDKYIAKHFISKYQDKEKRSAIDEFINDYYNRIDLSNNRNEVYQTLSSVIKEINSVISNEKLQNAKNDLKAFIDESIDLSKTKEVTLKNKYFNLIDQEINIENLENLKSDFLNELALSRTPLTINISNILSIILSLSLIGSIVYILLKVKADN